MVLPLEEVKGLSLLEKLSQEHTHASRRAVCAADTRG